MSPLSVAATVSAFAAAAGEVVHASVEPLPAATATNTPELARLLTASSSVWLLPPPKEMFATAGLAAWALTQLTAAVMVALSEPPPQLPILTDRIWTCLATP